MGKFFSLARCPNGYSVCFIIATLILIGLLLLWQATSQYSQFVQQQQQLSKQSVTGAANEISAYVDHLKHQVSIFSKDRIEILKQLAHLPENSALFEQLNKDAAAYFPNYFAITIADKHGTPIIGNYDLLVNEVCQTDIKTFARRGFNYDIFIHPHPEAQHFDIMTPIELFNHNDTGIAEVFFISFKPIDIQRILGNSQIFGHELFLIKNDINGLVELTASGTRVDLIKQNKNHILSENQVKHIDASTPVAGARWNLVSIADNSIYTGQKRKITRRAIYISLVFIAISILYLFLLSRLENKRKHYELQLKRTKEQLQHTLNFSRIGTWEYHPASEIFLWSEDAQTILCHELPGKLTEYLAATQTSDRPAVANYLTRCISNGMPLNIEHRFVLSNAAIVWIELSGSIDKDEHPPSRILGLIRDITPRKQVEQLRLENEKRQRETLVREVHHRIKNNLQGVIGLLRRHSKKGEISQAILEHAISQLNSVSLIHGLSCTADESSILLSELVFTISDAANNFTGSNITPPAQHNSVQQRIQNEDTAVAIALIINELIFNAIKHSPEDIDSITVSLGSANNAAVLTITNKCKQDCLQFDYDQSVGLGSGLNLIKSLMPKSGASFSVKKSQDTVIAKLTLTEPVIIAYDDRHRKTKQIA